MELKDYDMVVLQLFSPEKDHQFLVYHRKRHDGSVQFDQTHEWKLGKWLNFYRADDQYPDEHSRYILEMEVDHDFVRFETRLSDYYQNFSQWDSKLFSAAISLSSLCWQARKYLLDATDIEPMTVIEKDDQDNLIGIASEMTGELVRIIPFTEMDFLLELAQEHESFREIFEASNQRREEQKRHREIEERRRAIIERHRQNKSAVSKPDADKDVQPIPAWMKSKLEYLERRRAKMRGARVVSADEEVTEKTPPKPLYSDTDAFYRHEKAYPVCDVAAFEQKLKNVDCFASRDSRTDDLLDVLKKSEGLGTMVKLTPQLPLAMQALDQLSNDMPNFSEVIDYIRHNLVMASRGDQHVYFPAVVLLGPPGVGKTYFASSLAKCLHLTFDKISFENQTGNGSIAGTQAMYNNTRPGIVFRNVVTGGDLNPLILVDEVEKAGSGLRGEAAPINQLLGLLEKHSAQAFQDQSLEGFDFDASWINWVLTANDLSTVPEPVLSRTTVFEIAAPTESDLMGIVERMYQSLLSSRSIPEHERLVITEESRQMIVRQVTKASMSMRQIPKLLQKAYSNAIMQEATYITPDHLGLTLTVEKQDRRKVGFL